MMAIDKQRLQGAAVRARAGISNKLGDVWWLLLVRGLLAVALGIAALFWPQATLALLIRFIALYVLFDGIVTLFGVFRGQGLSATLGPGLISILVGAVLLLWPDVTARALLVLVGVWVLLQGGVVFLAGRQADPNDPERGSTMVVGAAAAVVGLVLVIWPGTGAVTISWAVGIAALLLGVLVIYLALRLRRVNRRIDSMGRV
jgi:uncharacterized membrane protein HdeD (DUF308 family)